MNTILKKTAVLCAAIATSAAISITSFAVEVDMTNVAVAESLLKNGGPTETVQTEILKDAAGNDNIYFAPGISHASSENQDSQAGENINTSVSTDGHTYPFAGNEKAYKYFALGNSITVHPPTDFWYTESGMSASKPENDFFHLVTEGLKTRHGQVVSFAYNYHSWEKATSNRNELGYRIEDFLDPSLDLVTVELGENVTDSTTLSKDFTELINHIKAKCPKAFIIIIDDFWPANDHSAIKATVASLCNVEFMSLAKVKENLGLYTCGLAATIYDGSGQEHSVKSQSVADHPGDEGMKYYANKILSILDRQN